MFISVNQLEKEMGVDRRIGRFFVDRKVPQNNSFWRGRLLYISFGNGYLSIPVYYDILYRIGMPLESILDEKHIECMEQVMHFAILQERNEISYEEELASIRTLLNGRVKDNEYYKKLNSYLDQPKLKPMGPFGLPSPSLNRADVFLYILCDLPLNKLQWEQAIRYWYSLHPTYLIMDDIVDFKKDRENNDDNVVIDLGSGADAIEKTFEMYKKNCASLEELNPILACFLLNEEKKLRGKIHVND